MDSNMSKLIDCHYFLNGECTKVKKFIANLKNLQGDKCDYRHNKEVKSQYKVCKFWKKGTCKDVSCRFRHPKIKFNSYKKPCLYFETNSCTKGADCPYIHGKGKKENSNGKLKQSSFKGQGNVNQTNSVRKRIKTNQRSFSLRKMNSVKKNNQKQQKINFFGKNLANKVKKNNQQKGFTLSLRKTNLVKKNNQKQQFGFGAKKNKLKVKKQKKKVKNNAPSSIQLIPKRRGKGFKNNPAEINEIIKVSQPPQVPKINMNKGKIGILKSSEPGIEEINLQQPKIYLKKRKIGILKSSTGKKTEEITLQLPKINLKKRKIGLLNISKDPEIGGKTLQPPKKKQKTTDNRKILVRKPFFNPKDCIDMIQKAIPWFDPNCDYNSFEPTTEDWENFYKLME